MSLTLSEFAGVATVKNADGAPIPAHIEPALANRNWWFPAIVLVYCGPSEISRWIRPPQYDFGISVAGWGGCDVAVQDAERRLMNLGYERIR